MRTARRSESSDSMLADAMRSARRAAREEEAA